MDLTWAAALVVVVLGGLWWANNTADHKNTKKKKKHKKQVVSNKGAISLRSRSSDFPLVRGPSPFRPGVGAHMTWKIDVYIEMADCAVHPAHATGAQENLTIWGKLWDETTGDAGAVGWRMRRAGDHYPATRIDTTGDLVIAIWMYNRETTIVPLRDVCGSEIERRYRANMATNIKVDEEALHIICYMPPGIQRATVKEVRIDFPSWARK